MRNMILKFSYSTANIGGIADPEVQESEEILLYEEGHLSLLR